MKQRNLPILQLSPSDILRQIIFVDLNLILYIAIIIWQFLSAAAQYNHIKDGVIAMSERLLESAASYSRESYRQYQLLVILLPAQKLLGDVVSLIFVA